MDEVDQNTIIAPTQSYDALVNQALLRDQDDHNKLRRVTLKEEFQRIATRRLHLQCTLEQVKFRLADVEAELEWVSSRLKAAEHASSHAYPPKSSKSLDELLGN